MYVCVYVCVSEYIYVCVCVCTYLSVSVYVYSKFECHCRLPQQRAFKTSDFGRKVVEQKSDNFLIHVTLTWLPGSIHLASGIIQK